MISNSHSLAYLGENLDPLLRWQQQAKKLNAFIYLMRFLNDTVALDVWKLGYHWAVAPMLLKFGGIRTI